MTDEALTPDHACCSAYGLGIFPMAENRDDAEALFWVDPVRTRGLPAGRDFHISRSLAQAGDLGAADYHVAVNHDFAAVHGRHCADRPEETWINDQTSLRCTATCTRCGHAHSLGDLASGERDDRRACTA